MSRFLDLIAVADAVVLKEFSHRWRWTRTDDSTADFEGILDLEVEMIGPNGDMAYLGKTITVDSATFASFARGETIQMLSASDVPTGDTYRLQQTMSDDGSFKTIEIIK